MMRGGGHAGAPKLDPIPPSTNPCHSKNKQTKKREVKFYFPFLCSLIADQSWPFRPCRLPAAAPGTFPGHPSGDGLPDPPTTLLQRAGSIPAISRLLWEWRSCNPATRNEIRVFSSFARPLRKRGMCERLQHLPTATARLPPRAAPCENFALHNNRDPTPQW